MPFARRLVRRAALSSAASVIAAIVCSGLAAHAQDANTVVRVEQIWRARQADEAGDHVGALALAERAAQLAMTPSLRLFIARQYEALGRHDEAFAAAVRCAREADDNPALANRDAVLTSCRALENTLQPIASIVVADRAALAVNDSARPASRSDPPWPVLIGGAVITAGGVVAGVLALATQSTLSAQGCTTAAPCDPRLRGSVRMLQGEAVASDALLGAGAVVLILGIVLFAISPSHPHAPQSQLRAGPMAVTVAF